MNDPMTQRSKRLLTTAPVVLAALAAHGAMCRKKPQPQPSPPAPTFEECTVEGPLYPCGGSELIALYTATAEDCPEPNKVRAGAQVTMVYRECLKHDTNGDGLVTPEDKPKGP